MKPQEQIANLIYDTFKSPRAYSGDENYGAAQLLYQTVKDGFSSLPDVKKWEVLVHESPKTKTGSYHWDITVRMFEDGEFKRVTGRLDFQ